MSAPSRPRRALAVLAAAAATGSAAAAVGVARADAAAGHGHGHGHGQGAGPDAVPGTDATSPTRASAAAGAPAAAFRREMDESMAAMMTSMHAPGYTGDPDIDFLAMMVPHHQGAVDMARLVLQHGRDPVTRQLAEEIIATQVVEIDGMRRRLALLRQDGCTGAREFPSLGGTRGPSPCR